MGRNTQDFGAGKGTTGYEGIVKPSVDRFPRKSGSVQKPRTSGTTYRPKGEEGQIQVTAEETINERDLPTGKAAVRKSTVPFARPGSVPEGQRRAGTNEVRTAFERMHKSYSDIINTARNVRRNPLPQEHHDAMDVATTHLMNSIHSYHLARVEGGLGTNQMDNDVAHGHLQDAVKHLTYAHETLIAAGVHDALRGRRLPHALPADHEVADLSAKSTTLERKGVGGVAGATKPYKQGVIGKDGTITRAGKTTVVDLPGKGKIEFNDSDLHAMARVFGREHPAIKKFYAMQGTQRGKQLRVTAAERREQGVVSARGAGVASGAPAGVNPKKRGSGRMIRTRFSTQANPSRNTPTWEG